MIGCLRRMGMKRLLLMTDPDQRHRLEDLCLWKQSIENHSLILDKMILKFI